MRDAKIGTPKIDLSYPRAPRVVMASGCFDLLHIGHLNLLWRAAQLGDVLLVGVLTDEGMAAYKGYGPEWGLQRRLSAIRSLRFVTYAEQQETTDPTPLLERWRPALFVHGDDWTELREGHETLERFGVEWKTLPYTPGISTTGLRERKANAVPAGGNYGQFSTDILFGGP